MKIDKKILSWLTTVPASDINFRNNLKQANKETLQAALKDKTLSKAAIRFIESEMKRKIKEEIPYY